MKKWYNSKTIWLNLVSLLIAVTGLINEDLLKSLGITNTTKYLIVIGFVNGVGNMILRLFSTSQKIE